MTLVSGGESDIPACGPPASFSVHLASNAVTPAGMSTTPGVTMWCVCGLCVRVLQRGHSGDGCVLASTLCKYDLRKGDLFVLSWARVRRVRRGCISSELIMCGGGMRSILLLPLVPRDSRCMYMAHVCFMSVVVTVWGSVGMYVV